MENERGAIFTRELPDGRVVDVIVQITGTARLRISEDAEVQWYQNAW